MAKNFDPFAVVPAVPAARETWRVLARLEFDTLVDWLNDTTEENMEQLESARVALRIASNDWSRAIQADTDRMLAFLQFQAVQTADGELLDFGDEPEAEGEPVEFETVDGIFAR